MICERCGNNIASHVSTCPFCRYVYKRRKENDDNENISPTRGQYVETKVKTRNVHKPLMILSVSLLLISIACFITSFVILINNSFNNVMEAIVNSEITTPFITLIIFSLLFNFIYICGMRVAKTSSFKVFISNFIILLLGLILTIASFMLSKDIAIEKNLNIILELKGYKVYMFSIGIAMAFNGVLSMLFSSISGLFKRSN